MKKISPIILLSFLCGFLCFSGSQAASAAISAKSHTGVKFVEAPTEESTDGSTDGSTDSGSTDGGSQTGGSSNAGSNGSAGGSTKPGYLPQTGEIAGGGLLVLVGAGIIYFLFTTRRRQKDQS